MDLKLTASELAFRDEFRAWLKAHQPAPWSGSAHESESGGAYTEYLAAWQRTLFDGGWAGIAWPKEYGGRGASFMQQAIFQEEMAAANAPEPIGVIGLSLVGPTIIAVGTQEQKNKYLAKILSGEEIWCQGFSEPNAGSDLASLGTRAVRDGDHYIVNGQKIWTSFAHIAHRCLLLTRTDPAAAKHRGITCLLVDMHSPGIEVRPLKMMSGDSAFNEVFFTDVRVPVSEMLGQENQGWPVAITALANERANLGSGLYAMFKRNLETLVEHARKPRSGKAPAAENPLVRQKLAQLYLELEIFRLNTSRALTKLMKTGMPGPEGSIQKIFWSEYNQRLSQAALEILGPLAQLDEFDGGQWVYHYLRSRGNTIEAGTSEVQRNIVAQRVLGLAKSY